MHLTFRSVRRALGALPLLVLSVLLGTAFAGAQTPVDLDDATLRVAPAGYTAIYDDPGVGEIQREDYDEDPSSYVTYGLDNSIPGFIRYFLDDADGFVLLYAWAAPDDSTASTLFGLVDVERNFEDRGAAFPVPEIEGVRTGISDQGNVTVLFRVGNLVYAVMSNDQAAATDVAVRQHAQATAPPTTTTTAPAPAEDDETASAPDAGDDEDDDGFPIVAIPAAILVLGAAGGAVAVSRRRKVAGAE